MTKEQILDIFYKQMAVDYSCSLEEIKDYNNYIKRDKHSKGTRMFKSPDHIAKMISLNGKFVLCTEDIIQTEAGKIARFPGEWMSLGQNLEKLNAITRPYGYIAVDQHHYYLPLGETTLPCELIDDINDGYDIRLYEREELEQFRDDPRFTAALSFCESAPDMLAVTAEKDGKILGMSGASADSDTMWQIGINVCKEARGLNLGPFLTTVLKEEILQRGKVPFYGTGESHIQSQKVALKSGFVPMWWEVYSYTMNESEAGLIDNRINNYSEESVK